MRIKTAGVLILVAGVAIGMDAIVRELHSTVRADGTGLVHLYRLNKTPISVQGHIVGFSCAAPASSAYDVECFVAAQEQ